MKDNESPMAYRRMNLVTGRQLRARTLAGMTQRDLATVLAVNERAVRFWERKHDRRPTSAPNDTRIEQALWRAL
jgi:DNA-binding transcriptional regulator YiaG